MKGVRLDVHQSSKRSESLKLFSMTASPSVAVVAEMAPRWITASSLRPSSQAARSCGGTKSPSRRPARLRHLPSWPSVSLTTMSDRPASLRSATRFEPMNPAPPVTNNIDAENRLGLTMAQVAAQAAHLPEFRGFGNLWRDSSGSSGEPADIDADQDHDAEQEAIDHERPAREVFENAHQAPDREEGRDRGDDNADEQHAPAVSAEMNLVQLVKLLESGKRNGRQTEQKRQPRRFGALEAEHQACGQGRARARHAGDERADLRQTDQ